jgi:hypothetical protein
MTPLVTFLCPSRGRPKSFLRMLESVQTTADDPLLAEMLVYLDDDDSTRNVYPLIAPSGLSRLHVVVGPRLGYARLHEVIAQQLVPKARGEWLFLWNDDAVMETKGWDTILAAQDRNSILNPRTNHPGWAQGLNVFPIVPTAWVEHVGWAKHGANDTWWQEIGKMLGRYVQLDAISVLHDRDDLTGGHQDQTRAENDYNYADNSFYHRETWAQMGFDAGRIFDRFLAPMGWRP